MEPVITKEIIRDVLHLNIECPDDFCITLEQWEDYREKWMLCTTFFKTYSGTVVKELTTDLSIIKRAYKSVDTIKQFYANIATECINNLLSSGLEGVTMEMYDNKDDPTCLDFRISVYAMTKIYPKFINSKQILGDIS